MHLSGKNIIRANAKKWQKIETVLVTTQKLWKSPLNHGCFKGSRAEGETLGTTPFCFSTVNSEELLGLHTSEDTATVTVVSTQSPSQWSWHEGGFTSAASRFPFIRPLDRMVIVKNQVRPEMAGSALEGKAVPSPARLLNHLFTAWFLTKHYMSKNASHGDNLMKPASPLTQNLAGNAQGKGMCRLLTVLLQILVGKLYFL